MTCGSEPHLAAASACLHRHQRWFGIVAAAPGSFDPKAFAASDDFRAGRRRATHPRSRDPRGRPRTLKSPHELTQGSRLTMQNHAITMLGTGLIGDFYTMTLHGQRGRGPRAGRVLAQRGARPGVRERWGIPEATTDLEAAIRHPDTDVVVVALPEPPPRGGRQGRRGRRQGGAVHQAARSDRRRGPADARGGRAGRRLRRLPRGPVLHAQDAQGRRVGRGRRARRRDLGPLPRDPPRARTAPGSGTAG